MPYCAANNQDDFNIVFACIATGVISGFGFSMMLKRFGASGGTYGISALLKKTHPEMNIAYVSFIMDASVVFIAFFVYGMKVTPVMCTLLNLFIANIIVDNGLNGIKNGYKFEIITTKPNEIFLFFHKKQLKVCPLRKFSVFDFDKILRAGRVQYIKYI